MKSCPQPTTQTQLMPQNCVVKHTMHALRGPTTALATSRSGTHAAAYLSTNISELAARCLPHCRLCSPQHRDQIQRRQASSKARKEKKNERALVRARRVRDESMASILREDDWSAFNKGSLKQGLRELDGPADSRKRGNYASKPLVRAPLITAQLDVQYSTRAAQVSVDCLRQH